MFEELDEYDMINKQKLNKSLPKLKREVYKLRI